MKIYIGPYRSYVGIWQLLDPLPILERDKDYLYDKLKDTWVDKFVQMCYNNLNRTEFVHIDKYDTWNMDHTLALIILPMLKQLKDTKHGAPNVSDDDVPEELRSYNAPPKEDEYDVDGNHFKRYDWVLNEMIFAFSTYQDDWEEQFHSGEMEYEWKPCENNPKLSTMVHGPNHTHKFDNDGWTEYHNRIQNGLRLFGTHYSSLWD